MASSGALGRNVERLAALAGILLVPAAVYVHVALDTGRVEGGVCLFMAFVGIVAAIRFERRDLDAAREAQVGNGPIIGGAASHDAREPTGLSGPATFLIAFLCISLCAVVIVAATVIHMTARMPAAAF